MGVYIDGVEDENISRYTYSQGITGYIDTALVFIPDPNQTLFLSTYSVTANYLYKDIQIKSNEILYFKGRINAPPYWINKLVIITCEGYMAQYSDRIINYLSTVHNPIEKELYTGYTNTKSAVGIKDTSQAWTPDEHAGKFLLLDPRAIIPTSKRLLNLNWQLEDPDQISAHVFASADDATFYFITNVWSNNSVNIGVSPSLDSGRRGYLRFPVSIRAGTTITAFDVHLFKISGGNDVLRYRLIDLDDCPAFPNGAGDESGFPVTETFKDYQNNYWDIWHTFPLADLLQAFIDRPGYVPGNYIGIRIECISGYYLTQFHAFDSSSPDLRPGMTIRKTDPDYPDTIDFSITDNDATELTLSDFNSKDFYIGTPYAISKRTDEVFKEIAEAYDYHSAVTVSKSESTKGIFRLYEYADPLKIMIECSEIDGFKFRLKNNLEFTYKPIVDIVNTGNLPETIIKFTSSNLMSEMVNVIKIRNKHGVLITRCWDYTAGEPVDDAIVDLPAGIPQRELFLTAPDAFSIMDAKATADEYLNTHTLPVATSDIELELFGDISYEPLTKVSFAYKGENYTDYIITMKEYDSHKKITRLKLVKY